MLEPKYCNVKELDPVERDKSDLFTERITLSCRSCNYCSL